MNCDLADWETVWAQMVEDLGAELNEYDQQLTPAEIVQWTVCWLIARNMLI